MNFCVDKTNSRFKNGCQLETTLQKQAAILPALYQEKQSLGPWVCLLPAGRTAGLFKCTIIELLNVHWASHCAVYPEYMYTTLMWVSNIALFRSGKSLPPSAPVTQ